MAAVEEPRALIGSQVPRILVVPDGVDHPRWDEIGDFIGRLGVELDEWQWLILRSAMMRNGDFWAAFTVAVCAPRQNGKNGILEVRELAGPYLLDEPLVIHSAHLADTSKEGFRRLDQLLEANEWLSKDVKHIWRTNGHEAIEFRNGNRIRFRTRTSSGGRGFAQGSPIMFDESMIFPEPAHTSIFPVASASPDPQLWYTFSAVDQETMEDGTVVARIRQDALDGVDPRLAYFEWSLDFDSPDEVPDEVMNDLQAVAATNPAFGVRILPAYIEAEARRLTRRGRAVERFGVGDWPDLDADASVIPLEVWEALLDEDAAIVGQPVFAFDVTPSRSYASIGVAGRTAGSKIHVDLADRRPGTGWVPERMKELADRWRPSAIVCDSVGPASSLIPDMKALGVNAETLTTGEYAEACAQFFDLAFQGRMSHTGHPELDDALKSASQRAVGDRWLWDRKTGDISPLVAVTQALGQVVAKPAREVFVAFG